ncbi:hypothetical protein GDO81_028308, partial [Engystomops pustulosus]
MSAAAYFIMVVADIVAFIFVFPGSIFIIAINLWDWINNKTLSLSDHLSIGVSVCNFLHGVLKVLLQLYLFLKLDCFLLIKYVSVSCLAAMSGNLWLCTLYSIYCCLKIVTFSQNAYVYLKKTFPKMLPWLLILTVLLTLCVSIAMAWDVKDVAPPNKTQSKQDLTLIFYLEDSAPLKIYIFACLCALLLFSSSYVTIMISLRRHIKQMRDNAEGSSSNVNVHIHAVKILTLSFLYDVIYFAAMMIAGLNDNDIVAVYSMATIFSICLVFNTVLLIKGNSKLNNA